MAISKTGGIQLSTEIEAELKHGKSLGAYRGKFFLHSPSNSARILPDDQPISFSQLDGCTQLAEGSPLTPTIGVTRQSSTAVTVHVSTIDTTLLTVDWTATVSKDTQPVLIYTPIQNSPGPVTRWFETTGGGYTEITANKSDQRVADNTSNVNESNYKITSSLAIPISTATTRTFVAVGYTFTSSSTGVLKSTNQQMLGHKYTVTSSTADEPVITSHTQNGGTQTSSGIILSYTDGSATSFPSLGIPFNYTFTEGTSPGWTKTARVETHQSFVSFNNGAFVASTAGGVGPYGPFHQSHDPTRPAGLFGYWVRSPIKFTTAGVYRFKLVSTLSVTFTKPDGTAGYVITATDESIHTTTIESKTVDNAIPTVLKWEIAEDSVSEDGGVVTVTIDTQHAIGQILHLSASENKGNPRWFGNSILKINSNSQSLTFTAIKRNHAGDRTLTLRADPYGTWTDDTRLSDTVILTNSDIPAIAQSVYKGDSSIVDEGESFPFTLSGFNFTEEDYTWDTTFPAAAVVATSGSFTTPYGGNYYTGEYSGSFTVDTVARPGHYEDVTNGEVNIYRADTGAKVKTVKGLSIRNTTAEPVTLPTALADLNHHVKVTTGRTGNPWSDKAYAIATLNLDGTYTVNNDIYSRTFYYAEPQPLEGDWVPEIFEAGAITESITQEDKTLIRPSGGARSTASFTDNRATLILKGVKLVSSIAESSVTFSWRFKNTASGATRPGAKVNLSISVSALPTGRIPIYVDIGVGGETGDIYVETPPAIVFIDDIDVYEPTTNELVGGEGGSLPTSITTYPAYGTLINTFCSGTTLNGRYHDGIGGSYNSVIALSSPTCGFVAAPVTIEAVSVDSIVDTYNQAEVQKLIDELSVLDLSDILSSINLNISF